MTGTGRSPEEVQEAVNRLADLLSFPEDFSNDPQSAMRMHDLEGIPDSLADVLAGLSPEELQLFAQVQRRLADISGELSICIIF